jgi:hypothetical protein
MDLIASGGRVSGDALHHDIDTSNLAGAVGDCLCEAIDMAKGRVEEYE